MEIKLPLEIIVKIGNKNEINFKDGICRVTIKERAEDGKANIEIVKYFSKLVGCRVRIIKGLKSKRKVIDYVK